MRVQNWIQQLTDRATAIKQSSEDMVALLQEYADRGWTAEDFAPFFPTAQGISQDDFMATLGVLQASLGALSTLCVALEKIIP